MGGNMLDKPGHFNPASHRFKITHQKNIMRRYASLPVGRRRILTVPGNMVMALHDRRKLPVEMVGDEVTSL
jgi:hypothetical protein